MELFKLRLSAINGVKFKIIKIDGGTEEESSLPFSDGRQDTKLFTVLNVLDAIDPNYIPRDSDDQEWMKNVGILSESKDKNKDTKLSLSPTRRQSIGQKLYDALFTGSIKNQLNQAIRRNSLSSLHIQIQYDANTIERSKLSLYPWQLVHDGQKFLAKRGVKFSFLIAYNDASPNEQQREEAIQVLLISSQASENQLENFQDKTSAINEGLTKAQQEGRACLLSWYNDIKEKPTFETLKKYLTNYQNDPRKRPNIIHFDGHGVFKKRCENPSCIKQRRIKKIFISPLRKSAKCATLT